MAFVAAKCTQCGADLQVDKTKEAANCEHCGSAFIVEKAINNYNVANAQINAQTVNVQMGATEQSLIDYANRFVDSNPKEAIKTYKNALKVNPNCYLAWRGIAEASLSPNPTLPIWKRQSPE